MSKQFKSNALIIIIAFMNLDILLYAQSNCHHTFTDQQTNIKSMAFKSVVLSNGDLIAAGYRLVNGLPKIVVDRFSFPTCSLTATYTLPYYSPPPAEAPMQLLVSEDDYIGVRYFNTVAPGTNYFIILDSNLNQHSLLTKNNSVYNRLMALTDDEGVILSLIGGAPSYNENLKIRRVSRNNLNNIAWNTVIKFPEAEIRIVSDIKTDSSNNTYVTGAIENNSGEMKLFVLKVDASGYNEWTRSYKLKNKDWNDWMFTKLTLDKQQRILVGTKSTDDSIYYLNIYCLAPDGTLLWKKKKQTDSIPSNKAWIDTDSLCNVYAAAHITGNQVYPSTFICKMDASGADVWRKTIANFRINAMKVNSAGNTYLAGDKFFTLVNPPSYKSHFKLLDTDGLEIGYENQHYTYDNGMVVSSYSKYNDVAFKSNGDAYLVGERHDLKPGNSEKDFYFIDSYENNIAKESIELKETIARVNIFPNPSEGSIAISWDNNENSEIAICDLKGKQLFNFTAYSGYHLNLDFLSSGIYLVKVVNIKSFSTLKLVKL